MGISTSFTGRALRQHRHAIGRAEGQLIVIDDSGIENIRFVGVNGRRES
jgi:hypothetical protein